MNGNRLIITFHLQVDTYVGPILSQFSMCYNASHGANPFIGWRPFIFHGISFRPFKAVNFRINSGYIMGGMYTTYLEYRF